MIIFWEPENNPGCKSLNKLKLLDVSYRSITPNWGAIKKPAENKTINY